jgi:hypothetical protein
MEDALACQVSDALGVVALQRREADHVKRLKDMRRVRWHAEGEDLVFKAVVLEILVEMALVAIQNKQPVYPHLARLCMRVTMLQPLKTKHVVGPAVLRD